MMAIRSFHRASSVASGVARRHRRVRTLAVIACLAGAPAAVPASLQGQEVGAAFLLLPASTRAMAMGGAAVAADGAGALFDDVAGLGRERASGTLAVQRHLAETNAATAAIGFRVGEWSAAAGVHLLDHGDIVEIIPDPGSGGEVGVPTGFRVSASDFAIGAGAARPIGPMRAGLAVKLVRQQVAEASGSTVAIDAGVRVPLPWRAMLSVGVQHLGGRVEMSGLRADLPALWRAGVASGPMQLSAAQIRLVGEVSGVREAEVVAAAGGEVGWVVRRGVSLAGRVGVRGVPDGDAGSPWSLGGALEGERVGIGYGYRGYEGLGGVHRVEVRVGSVAR